MSRLVTPDLDEFDKAVISFWFKVSQEVLDAAQKEEDDWYDAHRGSDEAPPPFLGLVPLIVFGKEGTSPTTAESDGNTETNTTSTTVINTVMTFSDSIEFGALTYTYTINWFPDPEAGGTSTEERNYYKTTFSYSPKPGKPTIPSFIAVNGNGNLVINFESTQVGDVTLADVITSATSKYYTQETANNCWTYQFLDGCGAGGDSVTTPFGLCGMLIVILAMVGYRLLTAVPDKLVDQGSSPREKHPSSRTWGSAPGDMGTGAIGGGDFDIPRLAADQWHHVLISVDMSGGSASTGNAVGESGGDLASHITATSLMYVAVDDVNYLTRDSSPFPGTNKVYTGGAAAISGMGQAADYDDDGNVTPQGPVPSYSLTDMKVPAAPVGIPATEKYADKIRKVQMAELLFFTGATLDTSKEDNRRHFITGPDKNKFQHPTNSAPLYIPLRKFAFGDPATWEPGADNPAWAPPLFDPSAWPTGIKALEGTADIDFTKCQWNWQMGRNLGTLKGAVTKTGKIKALIPPRDEQPKIKAGEGA